MTMTDLYTPPEGYEHKRRKEDASVFRPLNRFIARYKTPALILLAVLVASGFEWKWPKTQFHEIKQRLTAVEQEQANQSLLTEALAVRACLDLKNRPDDIVMLGIPCDELKQRSSRRMVLLKRQFSTQPQPDDTP